MSEAISEKAESVSDKTTGNYAWLVSFSAAMVPFVGFCHSHQKGVTVRVLESLAKTRGGIYGIFLLPFLTLGMEKSVYDTVQSIQGIDPNDVPKDRGGFPSGGSNLPSFSLVAVQKTNLVEDFIRRNFMSQNQLVRKLTQKTNNETQR